jgi:hypothetical protein
MFVLNQVNMRQKQEPKETINGGLIVKQSNHLTFSSKTFNEEQRRIFYEVIRQAQNMPEVEEIYQHEMFTQRVDIPIKNVLTPKSKDYEGVWDAAYDMMQRPLMLNYTDGRRVAATLFSVVSMESAKGCISVYVNSIVWQLLVNVSKNYTKYDLELARILPTTAAMTLYEIVAYQIIPLTFSIDFLKNMLGMDNEYPNNSHFIKYVVEASKKYIDKYSNKTFEYEVIKEGRKIVAVTIFPVDTTDKTRENQILSIINKFGLGAILSRQELYALKAAGFGESEITANSVLLRNMHDECRRLYKLDTFQKLILKLQEKAYVKGRRINKRKDNPKGWIISEIKRLLDEGLTIEALVPYQS